MNKLTIVKTLLGVGVGSLCIPAMTHGQPDEPTDGHREHVTQDSRKVTSADRDIDKLYELLRQARAELQAVCRQAGIRGVGAAGRGEHGERRREGRGEHAEGRRAGRGEHGERRREGRNEHAEGRREGRGEHGERRRVSGHQEEGGKRLGRNENWDATRNGARLILAYNAATQSFKGTVRNNTSKTLSDVRVEVHLSNGVELGPTKRADLEPGAKMPVELSAANQEFAWWTTHPEHGNEEGHGPGHEGEAREGRGNRPKDQALRPLYHELQLLRQELKMLARGLQERKP